MRKKCSPEFGFFFFFRLGFFLSSESIQRNLNYRDPCTKFANFQIEKRKSNFCSNRAGKEKRTFWLVFDINTHTGARKHTHMQLGEFYRSIFVTRTTRHTNEPCSRTHTRPPIDTIHASAVCNGRTTCTTLIIYFTVSISLRVYNNNVFGGVWFILCKLCVCVVSKAGADAVVAVLSLDFWSRPSCHSSFYSRWWLASICVPCAPSMRYVHAVRIRTAVSHFNDEMKKKGKPSRFSSSLFFGTVRSVKCFTIPCINAYVYVHGRANWG